MHPLILSAIQNRLLAQRGLANVNSQIKAASAPNLQGGVGHPGPVVGPALDPALTPEAFGRPGQTFYDSPQGPTQASGPPASMVNGLPLDIPAANYSEPMPAANVGGQNIPSFGQGVPVGGNFNNPVGFDPSGAVYGGLSGPQGSIYGTDPNTGAPIYNANPIGPSNPAYWSQGSAYAAGGDPGAFSARDARLFTKVR